MPRKTTDVGLESDQDGVSALEELLLAAALVGPFDPRALLPPSGDASSRELLIGLARDCDEVRSEGTVLWMLKPGIRREALHRTGRGVRLVRAIGRSEPRQGDLLGRFLKDILSGRPVRTANLDVPALDQLLTAARFAEASGLAAHAAPGAVRHALGRRSAEQTNLQVLPGRLFGRRGQLKRLARFIETGLLPARSVRRDANPDRGDGRRVGVVSVAGIAGAGKSALLAQLTETTRGRDWLGPPVVVLDFDKPAFASLDVLQMLFAVTRQLAMARPILEEPLSRFRKGLRIHAATSGRSVQSGYEASASLVTAALADLRRIIEGTSLATEPVVIILDTFEEVAVSGPSEVNFVLGWLDTLRDEGGISELRAIVSGRVAPHEVDPSFAYRVLGPIEVGDLSRGPAIALLRDAIGPASLDEGPLPLEDLVGTFGRNPLVLRILARFCRNNPRNEVLALLDGGSSHRRFEGEFAQRFLYTRILERIPDVAIRRLAHPGLVLRRVTPRLIQDVLAGPCDLGDLTAEDAQRLFEKLSRQVWLVDREVGAVRHRRDLRRLMLPLLMEERPEQARAIHTAAAEFYAREADASLPPALQATEALYHRMFISDAIEVDGSATLARSIGLDIDDLPLPSRAFLKQIVGRKLSNIEFAALPQALQTSVIRRRRRDRLDRGDSYAAANLDHEIVQDLHDAGHSADRGLFEPSVLGVRDPIAPAGGRSTFDTLVRRLEAPAPLEIAPGEDDGRPDGPIPTEWLAAFFDEGRFEDVVRQGTPLLAGLYRQSIQAPVEKERNDAEAAVWRLLLCLLVRPIPLDVVADFRTVARGMLDDAKPTVSASILASLGPPCFLGLASRFADPLDDGEGRMRAGAIPYLTLEGYLSYRHASLWMRAAERSGPTSLKLCLAALPVFSSRYVTEILIAALRSVGNERSLPAEVLDLLKLDHRKAESLSYVQSVFNDLTNAFVRLDMPKGRVPVEVLTLLRGMTPELHGTTRAAVAASIPADRADELVARLSSGVSAWPAELMPGHFGRAVRREQARWYGTLVETSDRFGLLDRLLEAAIALAPGTSHVASVRRMLGGLQEVLVGSHVRSSILG